MNKKKVFTLVCIFCLIVVLVGIGYLYYKNTVKDNPKLIFTTAIDSFATSVNETIDKSLDLIIKPESMNYNVSFNLTSSDDNIRKVASILNKTKFSTNTEFDYDKKIMNLKTNILYNNKSLLNANTYYNSNTMYFEVPELYNKAIRFQDDTLKEIWQLYKKEDISIIISELADIIKNNLKDEYFSQVEKDNLTNYMLNLSSSDLYNLNLNVINDMSENDSLLSAFANLSNLPKEDIKNGLLNKKQYIEEDNFGNLKVTITIDKDNEVKKIIIDINNDPLEFRRNDNRFDMYVLTNGIYDNIGTLELSEKLLSLNINYENSKLEFSIKKSDITTDITFNVNSEGNIIKIVASSHSNSNNGKVVIATWDIDNYVNLLINVDYKINEANNINSKYITSYIDIDKITENDLVNIQDNITKNETLQELIRDIMSTGIINLESMGNQLI